MQLESNVVRELFLRGLAAYQRDGKLLEVADETQALMISSPQEAVEIAA